MGKGARGIQVGRLKKAVRRCMRRVKGCGLLRGWLGRDLRENRQFRVTTWKSGGEWKVAGMRAGADGSDEVADDLFCADHGAGGAGIAGAAGVHGIGDDAVL